MKERKTFIVWKSKECLKYIFPLDFAKYLSYLKVQKNSKVYIRKKEICSKSDIKTFYGSKFLVQCILKLVYHCEGNRLSEICSAKDIAKKSLKRLLLLLILKSSYPRCTVQKVVLKNFANFTGKHECWSLFLIKLQGCNFIKKNFRRSCFSVRLAKFLRKPFFKNICEWLLLYLHFIFSVTFMEVETLVLSGSANVENTFFTYNA